MLSKHTTEIMLAVFFGFLFLVSLISLLPTIIISIWNEHLWVLNLLKSEMAIMIGSFLLGRVFMAAADLENKKGE